MIRIILFALFLFSIEAKAHRELGKFKGTYLLPITPTTVPPPLKGLLGNAGVEKQPGLFSLRV